MTATVVPTTLLPQALLETAAEDALGRVNAALATLQTGLAAFGADGTLLFANPRFGELFGLGLAEESDRLRFARLLDQMASHDRSCRVGVSALARIHCTLSAPNFRRATVSICSSSSRP